ncbi:MAG: SLC13 family permease [Proteobacteria bacterium]|nr:SLC13 family permease [Pseudomonadota bacterium]
MSSPALTTEMIMVMAMIGVAVFLFIVEWVRVDVVAIIMMVVLPILGLVTGDEAFIGLSSNAVVSIIAVIIIGAGLDKTGIINRLVAPIVKLAGNSQSRLILLLSATVAGISSFMQNIGAAALFLPAIQRVCAQTGIPLSRVLMPVGFAAILGGTITLVGCSPLILLNDLLIPYNLEPFGLFSVTPIGFALVGSGILYFIVFGGLVLPSHKSDGGKDRSRADVSQSYSDLGDMYELQIPEHSPLKPVVIWLRDNLLVHVVAVSPDNGKTKLFAPDSLYEITPGSVLVVFGRKKMVKRAAELFGMTIKSDLEVFKNDMSGDMSGIVEAVVAPRSQFIGKTLRGMFFRKEYQSSVLAITRGDRIYYGGIATMVLQAGDAILMHGSWERFHTLRERHDFIFTHPVDADILHPQKAIRATICFVVAIGLVLFTDQKLAVSLMAGGLGMILTKVLTIDDAYRSVDWRTIFLLGGLIPLGIATEKTGTAAYIAHQVLALIGNVSPIILLTVIGALSTVFTLVISNVGATVLLVPLVVNMAQGAGIDPRMAALVVGLATSNSFVLPTHQVNALYMGPGHYRSVDYMKAGVIMSFIFLAVMILMIKVFYGV